MIRWFFLVEMIVYGMLLIRMRLFWRVVENFLFMIIIKEFVWLVYGWKLIIWGLGRMGYWFRKCWRCLVLRKFCWIGSDMWVSFIVLEVIFEFMFVFFVREGVYDIIRMGDLLFFLYLVYVLLIMVFLDLCLVFCCMFVVVWWLKLLGLVEVKINL